MIEVDALWPALLEARSWLRQRVGHPLRCNGWYFRRDSEGRWSFVPTDGEVEWDCTASLVSCALHSPMPPSWSVELGLGARYIDLLWRQAATGRRRTRTLASFAQSLDGYIATRDGDSKWIGNDANLVHSHRLRALHDAILVGCRTLVMDQPELTVRRVAGEHPLRIVVTRQRQLPETFLARISRPTMVVKPAHRSDPAKVSNELVEICAVSTTLEEDYVCPRAILSALAERGIHSLMIEGGGITVSLFHRHAVLDEADIHIAPMLLGAGVRPLLVSPAASIAGTELHSSNTVLLGDQAMMSLRFD